MNVLSKNPADIGHWLSGLPDSFKAKEIKKMKKIFKKLNY
jgi:hypothetical protein